MAFIPGTVVDRGIQPHGVKHNNIVTFPHLFGAAGELLQMLNVTVNFRNAGKQVLEGLDFTGMVPNYHRDF